MATTKEKISFRRYFNWFLFLIMIVLVCFIASKLYGTFRDNQLKESVLSRVVGTLQYDDIDNAKTELVSDDFIFISYTKSENVRNLELKLKDIIVDNSLQNNFYYLDATDIMLDDDYLTSINNKFGLKNESKIVALPALLYYKNGKFVKTISSDENRIMQSDDFAKLLDTYEIIERK